MKANRVGRVFLGLVVLALFGAYTYLKTSTTPFSADIDARGGAAGVVTAAPAVTDSPVDPGTDPDTVVIPADGEDEPAAEATPEPTVDPNSPAGRALALGLPTPPDIDITSWEYIRVNTTHEIGADFAPPEIVKVGATACPQDARIADALTAFADDCAAQGLPVYLSSGYRSYNEQQANFQRKLNEGMSRETAAGIVAIPGTSEHQTGLCCDITDIYRPLKDPDVLSQTETFKWLNDHCAEYGFILRFPLGEKDITGIIYEPWHFRYVGVEAATYVKETELTWEEFVALYTGESVPGSDLFP